MGFAFRSWVEISLQQIADNFEAARAVVGPGVEVMPVVKADAYRHGAVEVSRTLVQAGRAGSRSAMWRRARPCAMPASPPASW